MFRKIGLTLAVGVALASAATAQSFDGAYRGTLHFVKEEILLANAQPCPRVGSRRPLVLQVSQSVVTIRNVDAMTFTGNVAADGSFNIAASTTERARGGNRRSYQWIGTIKGSKISGTFQAGGRGAQCYAEFTASK